jgi:NTE family protein
MGAVATRLFGSGGHFAPRLPSLDPLQFRSLYDLAPMKATLSRLIDFGRLNSGDVRVGIVATDVESGEPVLFDCEWHHRDGSSARKLRLPS